MNNFDNFFDDLLLNCDEEPEDELSSNDEENFDDLFVY